VQDSVRYCENIIVHMQCSTQNECICNYGLVPSVVLTNALPTRIYTGEALVLVSHKTLQKLVKSMEELGGGADHQVGTSVPNEITRM